MCLYQREYKVPARGGISICRLFIIRFQHFTRRKASESWPEFRGSNYAQSAMNISPMDVYRSSHKIYERSGITESKICIGFKRHSKNDPHISLK